MKNLNNAIKIINESLLNRRRPLFTKGTKSAIKYILSLSADNLKKDEAIIINIFMRVIAAPKKEAFDDMYSLMSKRKDIDYIGELLVYAMDHENIELNDNLLIYWLKWYLEEDTSLLTLEEFTKEFDWKDTDSYFSKFNSALWIQKNCKLKRQIAIKRMVAKNLKSSIGIVQTKALIIGVMFDATYHYYLKDLLFQKGTRYLNEFKYHKNNRGLLEEKFIEIKLILLICESEKLIDNLEIIKNLEFNKESLEDTVEKIFFLLTRILTY